MTYHVLMYTIAETPIFKHYVADYWSEAERGDFCAGLANNPMAGDVILGSGGCRKVRWAGDGRGKRGGVWVITTISWPTARWLLTIYGKGTQENIPGPPH
ncbi:hypothetical protein [Vogesella indigofera]|uniref:hypothetical protein n=1 Tax=Vogesella indigofera TaxID=45465 RepID=UPI00234ED347|nr:hypothetical protein [Vogesella indigofera]MDC7701662.1 hypothetical protein [Vogesella indigofera]